MSRVVELNTNEFRIEINVPQHRVDITKPAATVFGLENIELVEELGNSSNKVVNQYGLTQNLLNLTSWESTNW